MPRQTDHSDREILRSWSISQSRGKFLAHRLGRTTFRTSRLKTLNSRRISCPSPFLSNWANFHSITRRSAVSVTPSTCAIVPAERKNLFFLTSAHQKRKRYAFLSLCHHLLGIGVVGKRLNSVVKSRIRCPLKAALSPGVQPKVSGFFKKYFLLKIHALIPIFI